MNKKDEFTNYRSPWLKKIKLILGWAQLIAYVLLYVDPSFAESSWVQVGVEIQSQQS
jgi:hypothetical protein